MLGYKNIRSFGVPAPILLVLKHCNKIFIEFNQLHINFRIGCKQLDFEILTQNWPMSRSAQNFSKLFVLGFSYGAHGS